MPGYSRSAGFSIQERLVFLQTVNNEASNITKGRAAVLQRELDNDTASNLDIFSAREYIRLNDLRNLFFRSKANAAHHAIHTTQLFQFKDRKGQCPLYLVHRSLSGPDLISNNIRTVYQTHIQQGPYLPINMHCIVKILVFVPHHLRGGGEWPCRPTKPQLFFSA